MEKTKNRSTLSLALSVWGRTIVASIMCAVVYLSMSVLANGVFSRAVGYQLYNVDEKAKTSELVTEYRYKEGETLEQLGVKAGEGQRLQEIKELPAGAARATDIVTGIMMLFLFAIFPYNILWDLGSRDDNLVHFEHMAYDPTRGLRVGLLASIPAAALYAALVIVKIIGKAKWYLSLYRILNITFLPYINAVIGDAVAPAELSIPALLLLILPLLVVPAVCGGAYMLGYRQFSIHERLTYKNTGAKKKGQKKKRADDGEI